MSRHDARRSLRFDCLRESVDDVHRLRDAGYDMAGNWSLGMALQHLTKTMNMSVEGAPFRLPFFLRPVARWILFRTVLEGGTTRLPLPTNKHLRPGDGADVDAEISAYEAVIAKVMDDDTQLINNHPVFGKVSADQWRAFHAWHAAHHLSFLLPRAPSAAESPLTTQSSEA